jgi:hypothetical protein
MVGIFVVRSGFRRPQQEIRDMSDKSFAEWIEELKPFPAWLEGLTPEERDWAEQQIDLLRHQDCPNPEAVVRADYYSSHAEVTRWKALQRTQESAERIWSRGPANEGLIDMLLDGKRLSSPFGQLGDELREVLSGEMTREKASAFAMIVARFTARHVVSTIDGGSCGTQGREWALMELYLGRPTGRQASGGKFKAWPGKPLYRDKTPFSSISPN